MATVSLSSFSAVSLLLTPSQIGTNSIRFFFKPLLTSSSSSSSSSRSSIFKHTFAPKVLASSTAFVQTKPDSISDVKEVSTDKNILACPICYERLIWNGDPVLSVDSAPRCSLQCGTCKKAYFGNETHIDLTVASGAKEYGEAMPASTELFRVPLVSFLYERGWRQSFSVWGGFPGPQKEFELTKGFLKPVLGGNIVDASCGSGLFSRLFAKSGLFSLVVALDFSENMLKQCYEFINQEENFPKENFILIRADISRLPFASSSVDAVHAGAALHCWPSPSAAQTDWGKMRRNHNSIAIKDKSTTMERFENCNLLWLLSWSWNRNWKLDSASDHGDHHHCSHSPQHCLFPLPTVSSYSEPPGQPADAPFASPIRSP